MSITDKNGLKISSILFDFINNEVIQEQTLNQINFGDNFEKVFTSLLQ